MTHREIRTALVLLSGAVLAGATNTQAQPVIFENISAGGTFGGGGSAVRGDDVIPFGNFPSIARAMAFTPSQNAALGSIQIGLNLPTSGSIIDVSIFSSTGSGPGTLIESLGAVADTQIPTGFPLTFGTQALTLASALQPELNAGAEYFLVASPGTATSDVAWYDLPDTAGRWRQNGVDPWEFESTDRQLSFRILAVPEPTSMAILSVTALTLRCRRRW